MIYIKRDKHNKIIAIYSEPQEDTVLIDEEDPELLSFLTDCAMKDKFKYLKSDLELIRVIEDIIQILMDKDIVHITDFPAPVINKLVKRQKIRQQFDSVRDIMGND